MRISSSLMLITLILGSIFFNENLYGAENKEGDEVYNVESLPNDLNLHYTG